jgi:hypothetical protein
MTIALFALLITCSGCEHKSKATGTAYYFIFDQSIGSVVVRHRIEDTFSALVNDAEPGDIIAGVGANEDTERNAVAGFIETMPLYAFMTDSEQKYKIELAATKQRLQGHVTALLQIEATGTDLLGGFILAGKFFSNTPARACGRRVLVVFTDGVQQSRDCDFTVTSTLQDNGVNTIIERERQLKRLPDLSTVEVHFVGVKLAVSEQADMTSEKMGLVQDFWTSYCAAASTKLNPAYYGPMWSATTH